MRVFKSQARKQGRQVYPSLHPSAWLLTASSLSRYVYIPLGGSQRGLLGTLLSTAMTFAFVSYWHGSYEDLWCWAALNWLGVTVESGAQRLLERRCIRETLVSKIYHCPCGKGERSQKRLVWEGWWSPNSLRYEQFLPGNRKVSVSLGSMDWGRGREASKSLFT